MKELLFVIVLFAVLGCQSHLKLFRAPDGTTTVESTFDPKAGAPSLHLGPAQTQPSESFSLGWSFRQPSRQELANAQTKPLMVWGIALALATAGLFVARAYFPLIPTSAITVGALLAGGMIAASVFLPQIEIPTWAWLAAIGAALFIVVPGLIANHKSNPQPEPTP